LNRLVADTQILYALYKKHHWLVRARLSTSCICCSTNTLESRTS
jgi:hypothetical protein